MFAVPFAKPVVFEVPPESEIAPLFEVIEAVAPTLIPPPAAVAKSVSDQYVMDPP